MTAGSIALLGYNETQTRLVGALRQLGYAVTCHTDPVSDLSEYDHVVSFGYRHILRGHVIGTAQRPIMNLHISYLPYNRGAHPNFWAWVERTPHGVTLHEIDEGLDTGPIIAQETVEFESDDITLSESYSILTNRIEDLFLRVFPLWISGGVKSKPQTGRGSSRKSAELPAWVQTWDITAKEARDRYDADKT